MYVLKQKEKSVILISFEGENCILFFYLFMAQLQFWYPNIVFG